MSTMHSSPLHLRRDSLLRRKRCPLVCCQGTALGFVMYIQRRPILWTDSNFEPPHLREGKRNIQLTVILLPLEFNKKESCTLIFPSPELLESATPVTPTLILFSLTYVIPHLVYYCPYVFFSISCICVCLMLQLPAKTIEQIGLYTTQFPCVLVKAWRGQLTVLNWVDDALYVTRWPRRKHLQLKLVRHLFAFCRYFLQLCANVLSYWFRCSRGHQARDGFVGTSTRSQICRPHIGEGDIISWAVQVKLWNGIVGTAPLYGLDLRHAIGVVQLVCHALSDLCTRASDPFGAGVPIKRTIWRRALTIGGGSSLACSWDHLISTVELNLKNVGFPVFVLGSYLQLPRWTDRSHSGGRGGWYWGRIKARDGFVGASTRSQICRPHIGESDTISWAVQVKLWNGIVGTAPLYGLDLCHTIGVVQLVCHALSDLCTRASDPFGAGVPIKCTIWRRALTIGGGSSLACSWNHLISTVELNLKNVGFPVFVLGSYLQLPRWTDRSHSGGRSGW